jgi:hypothetical protein
MNRNLDPHVENILVDLANILIEADDNTGIGRGNRWQSIYWSVMRIAREAGKEAFAQTRRKGEIKEAKEAIKYLIMNLNIKMEEEEKDIEEALKILEKDEEMLRLRKHKYQSGIHPYS